MTIHERIAQVRHIISAMDAGQVIKVSKDDVDLISGIYREVAPGRRLNTSCQSCVQMALAYIAAWAEQNRQTTKVQTETQKKKKTNGL